MKIEKNNIKRLLKLTTLTLLTLALNACGGGSSSDIGTTPINTDNIGTEIESSGTEGNNTLDIETRFNSTFVTNFDNDLNGLEPWVIERDGTAHILKNINTNKKRFSVEHLYSSEQFTYFLTQSENLNTYTGLWRSDGTAEGTIRLFDMTKLPSAYGVGSLIEKDDVLYFTLSTGERMSLWKTDASVEGTKLIQKFYSISQLTFFKDKIYFYGFVLEEGKYIYTLDLTTQDIEPVIPLTSYLGGMIDFKDKLYFLTKYALMSTDGTEAGTNKVIDAYSGHSIITNEHKLFFQVNTDNQTYVPYVSDGTQEGTKKLSDVKIGSYAGFYKNWMIVNDMLFFAGKSIDSGEELWKSDGTESGTVMVKDINTGSPGSIPKYFVSVEGILYFVAKTKYWKERLFSTDGTPEGTIEVPGMYSNTPSNVFPYKGNFAYISDKNLFMYDGIVSTKLTDTDSVLQHDFKENIFNCQGNLLFSNGDEVQGNQLWSSDGSVAGTVLLKTLNITDKNSIRPNTSTKKATQNIINIKGVDYFIATEDDIPELWRSDSTVNGTYKVHFKDETPAITKLHKFKNKVLGAMSSTRYGQELFMSDGTDTGTALLKDINNISNGGSSPREITIVGEKFYFVADDKIHGKELWVSNGTLEGTTLLMDIVEGEIGSNPSRLVAVKETLYFVVQIDSEKILYKSKGTKETTIPVMTIPRDSNGDINYLTAVGEILYFKASVADSNYDQKLYRCDGTLDGTYVVKDIQSGAASNTIKDLFDFNDTLYFVVNDGTHGSELWKSDGTKEGTLMVKDIAPGNYTSHANIKKLMNFNGILYFLADDKVHGSELWKSNGTLDGTVLVKDINPGIASSSIDIKDIFEDKLIFSAFNGKTLELYETNGTSEGTVVIPH